jgi:hypothetical protein
LLLVLALSGCARLEAIAPDVDPLSQVDAALIGDWTPVVENVGASIGAPERKVIG